MKLLVVRHGQAGDREQFAATGKPDDLRPLTKDGAREMKEVARALRELIAEIDVLATSPLVRAHQTADVVASAYGIAVIETNALKPDSGFPDFETWARRVEGDVVAIVGHEPHLSGLIAWLIGASGDARLALKKSGACLVDFDGSAKRGQGTLLWLLSPGAIRRIRKA